MPPSRMMIPCAGAPVGPNVGVGPAGAEIGVAIAGAETASAVRTTAAGSASRLRLRSEVDMSTFRLLTDAHVYPRPLGERLAAYWPPAASRISGESKSTSAAVRSARLALPANWCW
jgi:hypothetical protein